jgi:hypothetical protein
MSTSIKKKWEWGSLNMPWKIADGKVLAHLGFRSKISLGPLTDISAWRGVGVLHSRMSNIDFVIWIFVGDPINIP